MHVNRGTILTLNLQAEDIQDTMPLEVFGNLRITLELKTGVTQTKVTVLYRARTEILIITT